MRSRLESWTQESHEIHPLADLGQRAIRRRQVRTNPGRRVHGRSPPCSPKTGRSTDSITRPPPARRTKNLNSPNGAVSVRGIEARRQRNIQAQVTTSRRALPAQRPWSSHRLTPLCLFQPGRANAFSAAQTAQRRAWLNAHELESESILSYLYCPFLEGL